MSNYAFKPHIPEYSERYEETQSYSATFNRFHQKLAQRLIEKYHLRNKHVVEIGCGKGEFLKMICAMGENRGTGFDPGAAARRPDEEFPESITFVRDFFSTAYADVNADIIICKMTLEHIHDVGSFLAEIRDCIGDRSGVPVFFQVPDATRILKDCAFEDIYYEHCSYFSEASLRALFARHGFEIDSVSTGFSGQYLTLEGVSNPSGSGIAPSASCHDLSSLKSLVTEFPRKLAVKQAQWRDHFQHLSAQRKKTVIWGAASKAVALMSSVNEAAHVEYGVDINPHKHGFFLPGGALPIVGPNFLAQYRPDHVIVMNPIYREEIERHLDDMNLHPVVATL
ncbi:MAG: class I SAM-dependent methyltransferase [Pseudomonadota bacterium]